MDNEYAVDHDMAAIVEGKRSNSFDRFTGAGRRHDQEKCIRLPGRVQTPQDDGKLRKLINKKV